MKLLELEVGGYRSLKQVVWKPGALNVLIGPNGSGKTNLARVLEFMAVCARGGLADHIQKEGGFSSMLWDGRASQIRLRVTTSVPGAIHPLKKILVTGKDPDSVTYEIEIGKRSYSGIPFGVITKELLNKNYADDKECADHEPAVLLERNLIEASIYDETSKAMKKAEKDLASDTTVLSLNPPPFPQNDEIGEFQSELDSWTIYQDLWPRVYSSDWSGQVQPSIRIPSVVRTETRLASDGRNLLNFLHTVYQDNREFEREINAAMQAAFGNDFERINFAQAGDNRIQLRIRWKSLERDVSAADLSDGTLRFLFLIAVLANPSPPPLIVIEEPEIGLHPKMLPIIAEYAVDAALRTQVIFTTHSPDFLTAFRETAPTVTTFQWDNGQTILRVLEKEYLDYWLKEYSLGELYRSGDLEPVE